MKKEQEQEDQQNNECANYFLDLTPKGFRGF